MLLMLPRFVQLFPALILCRPPSLSQRTRARTLGLLLENRRPALKRAAATDHNTLSLVLPMAGIEDAEKTPLFWIAGWRLEPWSRFGSVLLETLCCLLFGILQIHLTPTLIT